MRKDIAIEAKMPEEPLQDALTAVLRDGARKMLAVALEKEVVRNHEKVPNMSHEKLPLDREG